MTLRIKPVGTVSVTKKPDGRLVLHYARLEGAAVPAPLQVGSTTASTEGCATSADVSRATEAARGDGQQNEVELKPASKASELNSAKSSYFVSRTSRSYSG